MMSANSRIRFGLQIAFVCLYIKPYHYHHCANLIWRHWTYKMPARYNVSTVWVRLSIFSQLSIMWGCVLSVYQFPLWCLREYIYTLSYYHHQIGSMNCITHCLGLGHGTMVCAVCKSGEMRCPDNYRKITLLSSVGKLFDSVLNNRLCFCKEALRVHNPWHNGFKPGSRTTHNLFIFNAIIDKHQATKKPLYVCYVDFKSAFDYVYRHALLLKLLTQGFTGKMF